MRKRSLPFPTSCDRNTANETGGKKGTIKKQSYKTKRQFYRHTPAPYTLFSGLGSKLDDCIQGLWLTLSSHLGYHPHLSSSSVPSLFICFCCQVVWHSLIRASKDSAVWGIGKTNQILLSQAGRSPGACPHYGDCFGSWIQLARISH